METLLVKIFATALALSQVTTAPEAISTRFDRETDQPRVAALLGAGCTHMRKAFDIEDINLDELIATAMDDPQAMGESKAFRGINFADLLTAYRQFCKNEQVSTPASRRLRSRVRRVCTSTSCPHPFSFLVAPSSPLPTLACRGGRIACSSGLLAAPMMQATSSGFRPGAWSKWARR